MRAAGAKLDLPRCVITAFVDAVLFAGSVTRGDAIAPDLAGRLIRPWKSGADE
jgi:hypothetical protein